LLLLLLERLLLPLLLPERLPLALARPPDPLLLLLLLLRPLEALPLPLLLLALLPRDEDDLEEEEELRDAIACSPLVGYIEGRRSIDFCFGHALNLGRRHTVTVGSASASA
jgi:hypothetical protein